MKNIILKVSQKGGMFFHATKNLIYKDVYVATVKDRRMALKKFLRREEGGNIIVPPQETGFKIYENRLKEYEKISDNVIFSVIENVVRQCVEKFRLKIPLCEIYIAAPPHIACSFIITLRELSRLYTVVSPEKSIFKMYDELYFKYGSVIRHIPSFDDVEKKDSIVINYGCEKVPVSENVPIIDILGNASGKNTVSLKNIFICDEEIENIRAYWDGNSGAVLYTILGKTPENNMTVDINRKCDRIFLLDTETF